MSDLKISREKLLDTSSKWSNLPDKSSSKSEINSLIEVIRILEDSIKSMRQKRYTYKDIAAKLLEEFHIDISPQTLASYLATIKKERKNSLLLSKREARRSAKAELSKQLEPESFTQADLSVNNSVEPLVDLEGSAIHLSIEPKSTDAADSTGASINSKPSNNKKTNSKSLVPKVNPVESSVSTDDEDEIERIRQAEMLKHFNKY
ncbi:MAG: hypothetical protein IM537_21860 [Pseudanabaena sp. M57BS1SP1A06MG]|jgi:hypothetical protein|nr:hypothetical protein [Pseudanabaena sp. M53BS1SP1A06MG]MCA6583443.1 hypothetical protein [Pseudanabaena sp. M34BS1SP1A06MG]MCA6591366.1 hypothetical protein [Pseudanabaena sp. M38BS1SP1A06MG]MCA6602787.1 hypothetical protein [Pseudanabaena sp. M57BS1SP1A06MG]